MKVHYIGVFLSTCYGIMTSIEVDTGQQALNLGHVCKLSSLIFIVYNSGTIDLCSSFESVKIPSDLRVTNARICCIKNF